MTYQPGKNSNRCSACTVIHSHTRQRKDVVQLFMNAQIDPPRELEDVIVSYLRRNNEISRLLKARFGACIAHRSLRHF